jgi:hypothetical protein
VLGNSFVGPTDCTSYGGPFCIYPTYTQGSSGVHHGVDFPDEINDLGSVDQFAQTEQCGGPFGPDSSTVTRPFRSSCPNEPRRAGRFGASARLLNLLISVGCARAREPFAYGPVLRKAGLEARLPGS